MIMGIGTDIIETARIKKAIQNPRFVERVYTLSERDYCNSRGAQRAASFAARFAAKEAVAKAFGTGFFGGAFADIEILPDALGRPTVHLFAGFAALAEKNNVTKIHISLSHVREYATAVCALEVNK